MWRTIISGIGAAVSAVGRAIDAGLGAIAGGVLSVASAIAPKAPPRAEPDYRDGGGGICPGGRHWRGPFPTPIDADEYRMDIPVPTSIVRYSDGWWVYVPDTDQQALE